MIEALAIRAVLAAAGKRIVAGFAWLLEHPWHAALMIAGGWLLWIHLFTLPGKDASIADLEADVTARTDERDEERRQHNLTKQGYRNAQIQAAALERARLARVAAEQETISDEELEDYRGRVAVARADAERLRSELLRAGSGIAGAGRDLEMPGAADAAGRADAPAGNRGLPLTSAEVRWRLVATEQAIQLDELIDWVGRQAAIDPND